ncbi:MAG: class I SAM-dependent methyltransferase [Phycisphaerales bacterium]
MTMPAAQHESPHAGVFETDATVSDWDTDYYHPIAERLYDRQVARMIRALGVPPGGPVTDAGCGPGVHAIRAAKLGHRVEALDLSHTMLGEAQRRATQAGVADSISFRQADLTALDIPDASRRHVFSWGVVIHIPDAEAALANLARIIEPGGRLALHLTNATAFDHTLERWGRFVMRKPLELERRELGPGCWYDMNDERLWVWRFDLDAVAAFLARRGLTLRRRWTAECSEIQRRVNGPVRSALLRANNAAATLGVPARWSATNLLVFERTAWDGTPGSGRCA